MNELKVFENPEFGEIRMVEVDGKPYAVGVDVARALGYANPSKAVIDHCKGDFLTWKVTDALGRIQDTRIIPEGDIYRLIVKAADQSKSEEVQQRAAHFESWIFDDVIPSIRKHGAYMTPEKVEEILSDPDTIIQLATQVKVEREKRLALEAELDRSKEWYSIKRVAAINGCSRKQYDWKRLKTASIEMGYGVKKIFDANYGEVNTYHMNVWEAVYPRAEL